MTTHLFMAAILLALAGCSEEVDVDLAACKAKAIEAVSEEDKEESALYLRECMRAEGWPLRDACLDKQDAWDSAECYLR
jgi:hypothetical protein